jgi:hypothetical protein
MGEVREESNAYTHKKETNMRATMLVKASILALTLTLSTVSAWAAESGVAGACLETPDDEINTTALDPLAATSVTIPNTGSVWHCAATCSVQADNPFSGPGTRGQLALRVAGTVVPSTERNFELTNNSGDDDPDFLEVSTGGVRLNLAAGTYTFDCAARKLVSSEPNFNINRSCINVVCSDFAL